MLRHIVAAALLTGAAAFGLAEAEEDDIAPCEASPYTDFDFWIGDWEVRSADGTLQGYNAITREERGCLILENWTSVTGGTGQSYNYYDPGAEVWRQIWVSEGAIIDYKGGLDGSGAMVLFGDISYRAGTTAPFMGRWEVLEDGSIRQHFQEYDPQVGDWTEWFTGYYTRVPADAEE